jgi:hypothetical protein
MKEYYRQRRDLALDIDSELPPEPLFEDVRPLAQVVHPPRKRVQLWFVRRRLVSATRHLHRLTTQRITRVLFAAKETLKDRNRTMKLQ